MTPTYNADTNTLHDPDTDNPLAGQWLGPDEKLAKGDWRIYEEPEQVAGPWSHDSDIITPSRLCADKVFRPEPDIGTFEVVGSGPCTVSIVESEPLSLLTKLRAVVGQQRNGDEATQVRAVLSEIRTLLAELPDPEPAPTPDVVQVKDMVKGDVRWVTPWSIERNTDGRMWIAGHACGQPNMCGTASVELTRHYSGCTARCGSSYARNWNWGTEALNNRDMIRVVSMVR